MTRDNLLHILWSKAVGTKDYNKEEWRQLEKIVHYYHNWALGIHLYIGDKEIEEEVISTSNKV